MRKQQIIIFLLVGIMTFSMLGVSLAVVLGNKNDDNKVNDQNNQNDQIAQCLPNPINPNADPIDPPEVIKIKEDITELKSEDIVEGTGNELKAGDCVEVHYHGWVAKTGEVFDSSYERGQTAKFSLDGLIEGWQEGMPGMKVGGQRRLIIPSEKAYGEAGSPPSIGPNTDLIFHIELVDIDNS